MAVPEIDLYDLPRRDVSRTLAKRVAKNIWDGRHPPAHCMWDSAGNAFRDRQTAEAQLYIDAINDLTRDEV